MKIKINQLPEGTSELEHEYDYRLLDIEKPGIAFTKPIHFHAEITKVAQNVAITAKIDIGMKLDCARCLESFDKPFVKKFSIYKNVNQDEVDIAEDIREEIVLSLPLKALCKEDCLGLCPNCGKNLNAGECGCVIK